MIFFNFNSYIVGSYIYFLFFTLLRLSFLFVVHVLFWWIDKSKRIYIYNSVELNLSVRKLLQQLKCDRHEKWNTIEVLHGECHGGVGGRLLPTREEHRKNFLCAERRHVFACIYGMHIHIP